MYNIYYLKMCSSVYQSSRSKIAFIYLKKNKREQEANCCLTKSFFYHITFYPKALLQWRLESFSVNFTQDIMTHSEIWLRRQNSVVTAYTLLTFFPIWVPCTFIRTFFVCEVC